MKKLITCLSLPILLAACSSNSKTDFVKPVDLQHHHWVLSEIDGKEVVKNAMGSVPDLEISENMQSNGNAGCNGFHGQAEINKDTGQFRINKMGMTMKLCPGDAMKTERIVASTLSAWSNIDLTKETLKLSSKEHTLTYTLRDWVN
ncbi:META domain-containing protein [Vibrio rumoiensis]|uniref:Heat-shock protein HslJ n=1 Tax=Vibrio rumoiensis 1S-45 TaxID=1188252 RepID=A0A1E5E3Z2_9VIBR|nr:heat-shock protein HslJ [Vibrio rumoiensis 1S-45]